MTLNDERNWVFVLEHFYAAGSLGLIHFPSCWIGVLWSSHTEPQFPFYKSNSGSILFFNVSINALPSCCWGVGADVTIWGQRPDTRKTRASAIVSRYDIVFRFAPIANVDDDLDDAFITAVASRDIIPTITVKKKATKQKAIRIKRGPMTKLFNN